MAVSRVAVVFRGGSEVALCPGKGVRNSQGAVDGRLQSLHFIPSQEVHLLGRGVEKEYPAFPAAKHLTVHLAVGREQSLSGLRIESRSGVVIPEAVGSNSPIE
jgi:hypothetical protein